MQIQHGWVYCFSNRAMPNLLKIGMTSRTPLERLKEANKASTWSPPSPYVLEFAKYVQDYKTKEVVLHKLLSKYTCRVNPRKEFFSANPDDIRTFFDLMDGDYWSVDYNNNQISLDNELQNVNIYQEATDDKISDINIEVKKITKNIKQKGDIASKTIASCAEQINIPLCCDTNELSLKYVHDILYNPILKESSETSAVDIDKDAENEIIEDVYENEIKNKRKNKKRKVV